MAAHFGPDRLRTTAPMESPNDPQAPRFASALSVDPRSPRAEEQVAEGLLLGLDGRTPDLLAVFVSHHHGGAIEELGPRLKARTGAKAVLGCTGESIIGGSREVEQEPALSIWGASLPGSQVRPFSVEALAGPDGVPVFSALPPVERRGEASVLLLGDPHSFPMDDYLGRLNEELPGVPVVGGMASGGMGPGQNLLIHDGGLLGGGALGAVIEGAVEVRSIVSQGCRPVGKPWVVTSCHEHLLHKLGGRPAVDVLMETLQGLGPEDQKLFQRAPFIGLAIDPRKSEFERGDFLVRGILGLQAKERAIAVAEVLRKGQTVQFLVRDAASASEDLQHLLQSHARQTGGEDARRAGALLFSCNGRGTRMFAGPDHDVGCLRASLAGDLPVAGFFAMGEIGPVGGKNFLHGFTASVALFRQRG